MNGVFKGLLESGNVNGFFHTCTFMVTDKCCPGRKLCKTVCPDYLSLVSVNRLSLFYCSVCSCVPWCHGAMFGPFPECILRPHGEDLGTLSLVCPHKYVWDVSLYRHDSSK